MAGGPALWAPWKGGAGRTVRQLGCPIKLSDCPAAYRHAGYPEGWHTEAVLTGLGYTAEEIRDLSEEKQSARRGNFFPRRLFLPFRAGPEDG